MFEPVVKWNTQITEAEIIPESVRKALRLAEYEKPGATHLEYPKTWQRKSSTWNPSQLGHMCDGCPRRAVTTLVGRLEGEPEDAQCVVSNTPTVSEANCVSYRRPTPHAR